MRFLSQGPLAYQQQPSLARSPSLQPQPPQRTQSEGGDGGVCAVRAALLRRSPVYEGGYEEQEEETADST